MDRDAMSTIVFCRVCTNRWDMDHEPDTCQCWWEHSDYELIPIQTPERWLQEPDFYGTVIHDPDGWRGLHGRPMSDEISREEFVMRLSMCTVDHRSVHPNQGILL